MIIEITKAAQDHIHKVVQQQNAHGFLFGVKDGGCNGKEYLQGFVQEEPDMTRFEMQSYDNGLKVYIPNECTQILFGLKMDYVMEGVNSRLVLVNPNATGGCGCGKSFNT